MKNEFLVYIPSPWPQPWPDCSIPHILTPGGARTGAWRASTPVRTQGIDSENRLQGSQWQRTQLLRDEHSLVCLFLPSLLSGFCNLKCFYQSGTERNSKAPSPCILLDCRSNMRGRGPSDSPAPCVFQIICRFEVLAVLTATESKKPPVTASSQVRSDLEHSRESTQLSNTIHQALHS